MSLKDEVPDLLECIKNDIPTLSHNEVLFNIYEGDLLTYVLADLKCQFSEKTFDQVKHRVPPINVLKRLIDKLSKIYNRSPIREVVGGSEIDAQNLSELIGLLKLDSGMSVSNEFFNLFKNTAVEPYLDNGVPKIRSIPSDRFYVHSNDPVSPTRPTHFVKFMGSFKVGGDLRKLYYGYTDTEFIIFDSHGEVRSELMLNLGNPEGVNIFGRIPFTYINRSLHNLIPKVDTDTLAMTKLIPVLLADCNFCSMFQSFSITYGIDVTDQNLTMSPNAFWSFVSDPNRETKPEIGVIKPDADTDKQLSLIKTELAMWMDSKNIKPGTIGTLNSDNAASGVAKMIDQADTSEDRQRQTMFFSQGEADLLDLIVNHMHPKWMDDPSYVFKKRFTPNLTFSVRFQDQKPIVDQSVVIDDEIKKIDKRLTTRKAAIKAINPDMTDAQVMELIEQINAEYAETEVTEPYGGLTSQ